jgi:hypothetical protein
MFLIENTMESFVFPLQAVSEEVFHNMEQKVFYANQTEFWAKTKKLKTLWVRFS